MKAKITYARLQERVAAAAGIPKKEAQNLLKEMTAAVGAGLVADGKVNLAGLGRFSRKVQRARRGRNPQTGEPIDIPEKNRVDFLPEARWRRSINREFEQVPVVPAPEPPIQPATPKTLPPRKTGSSHQADPQKPTQPIETETVAPVIPPPASPAADTGDITPAEETDRKHRHKLAPTIGVILLVAATLFFLWPRARAPEPPVAPRPVPSRAAVSKSPGPPETSQLEPKGQVAFETAAIEAAPMELTPVKPATASGYTVVTGDSLWKIASTAYDYPYFWPVIFLANHADIQHPDTLTVGMHLAIPAFAGRVGQLVESDFQQLADGYLRVYQIYRQHHHPRAPYYLWVAYRLRAHWVPDHELLMGKPEDREFIYWIKGRGLIH